MIKHYCDICGKEYDNLYSQERRMRVVREAPRAAFHFGGDFVFDLCPDCDKRIFGGDWPTTTATTDSIRRRFQEEKSDD